VCRVFLHATDESVLRNGVEMGTLRKYAAAPEAPGGGAALDKSVPVIPSAGGGGIAKETH